MDAAVERAQAKSRWWQLWALVNSTNEPFVNWLSAHAAGNKWWAKALEFMDGACLRSFSQVVFINNSLSGLVILVSLIAYDYVLGLLALLAAFVASLVALIIGFNYGSIRTGLFGYSAVLCGCAMSATDGSIGARIGLTVITAAISTALSVFFGTALAAWRVAPLTLPFNVAAVLMFVALKLQFASGGPPPTDEVLPGDAVWRGSLRGVAQIFLVNNEWVGIAMLLGVALSSRYLSLGLLLGSATGVAIAFAVGGAVRDIDDGLYSFNASLGCAAIWFFYVLTWRSVLLGLLCAAGTVLLRLSLVPPSFTLPFCLAALTFLFFNNSAQQLYSIKLPDLSTPEAHRLAFLRTLAEKKKSSAEGVEMAKSASRAEQQV
jgi:solute carrier family 14 (urea transporter)